MNEIILTEAKNGSRVSAAIGDMLILKLPENPTTGYRWVVQTTNNLAQVGDDFFTDAVAAGAGGERCLRFAAQSQGEAHIVASLQRSWEAGKVPHSVFKVVVDIR